MNLQVRPMSPTVWFCFLAALCSTAGFFLLAFICYKKIPNFVPWKSSKSDVIVGSWASVSAEPDGIRKIFSRGVAGSHDLLIDVSTFFKNDFMYYRNILPCNMDSWGCFSQLWIYVQLKGRVDIDLS